MTKVWTNLSGTTASAFTIGKSGATIHQGTGAPDDEDGVNGDVYIRHGSDAGVYQKSNGAWTAINDAFLRQTVTNGVNATIADATTYMAVTGPWESGSTTLTLPIATSGKQITIKDESGDAAAHAITISGDADIDGEATYVISTNYGSVTLTYSGSDWYVVRRT